MDNEFLTVKDVAVKLKVKPVTVYKWLREGKLKGAYFKLGGIFRFNNAILERYLGELTDRD